MRQEGLSADVLTFAFILKACGSTLAAGIGEEINAKIATKGFLGNDTVFGNALVDMYAKCGLLVRAQELFDNAQIGNSEQVLNCLVQCLGMPWWICTPSVACL